MHLYAEGDHAFGLRHPEFQIGEWPRLVECFRTATSIALPPPPGTGWLPKRRPAGNANGSCCRDTSDCSRPGVSALPRRSFSANVGGGSLRLAVRPLQMRFGNKAYALEEDERVAAILANEDTMDASDWLKRYPKGRFSSHDSRNPDEPYGPQLAPIVARLTKAGAKQLLVHHGDRTFFLGLIVVLPSSAKARVRIFELERELSSICNQAVQKDHGQKYLYYSE